MRTHIVRISVTDLFGDRTIDIRLPEGEPVAFLHGANGLGKSTILQMVNALFGMRHGFLRRMNFSELVVTLADNRQFGVRRTGDPQRGTSKPSRDRRPGQGVDKGVQSNLLYFCGEAEWASTQRDLGPWLRHLREIDEWSTGLRRNGPETFLEMASGYELELEEVATRYPDLFPEDVLSDLMGVPLPPELESVAKGLTVEYVGADRLIQSRERRGPRNPRMAHRAGLDHADFIAVVDTQRQSLRAEIARALADYAEYSQSLDRTFPLRLLDTLASTEEAPPSEAIRSQVNGIAAQRARFEKVGLLDVGHEELTPDRAADAGDNERRMLGLYLEDVRRKLERLDNLAERLTLFQRLVNAKFDRKRVVIERTDGYAVRDLKERVINPSDLSSGEQHELVLLYRLIFAGAGPLLFLVDEPELSLHVAWQQSLTADLADIASLADAQFVLATHSPIVTGDRWELLTELNVSYPNNE